MAKIGEKWTWFDGKVVDVKDPNQSGRVRVRIKGYHDDETKIPNDKLPWAQVLMPITSASAHKVGVSPTGLLPGSNIIGFFYDVDRVEMPFVIGTFVKAGDLKPGGTSVGGTEPVDEKTNSANPQGRNKDLDPKPLNNALDPNAKRNSDDEQPNKSITEVAAEGLAYAAQKTIGALASGLQGQVLNTILSIDPSNISGSIPSALNSMLKIDAISSVMNASGVFNMAISAMQSMAFDAINQLGGDARAVNNVLSTLLAFIESEEFSKLSPQNQQLILQMADGILSVAPSIAAGTMSAANLVNTASNVAASLNNPAGMIQSVVANSISSVGNAFVSQLLDRGLNAANLEGLIGNLSNQLISNGLKAVLGSNFDLNNIIGQAASILSSSGANLIRSITQDLPQTAVEQSKVQPMMEEAAKAFYRTKKKQQQNPYDTEIESARAEAKARIQKQIESGATSGSVTITTSSGATVTQSFGG